MITQVSGLKKSSSTGRTGVVISVEMDVLTFPVCTIKMSHIPSYTEVIDFS